MRNEEPMRLKRLLSVAFLGGVIGVAHPNQLTAQTTKLTADEHAATATASVQVKPAASNYIIGPGDMLAVNVWKEPEISRTLPVRPDGNISLPLAGDLAASGRTPVQLQNDIRQQLLTYFSNP